MNKKQEEGLREVKRKYLNGEGSATIAGFAGTGKTFLTSKVIESLNLSEHQYVVGCFTGKAAQVQKTRGQGNALTLHKLLFNSFKDEKLDRFVHRRKPVGALNHLSLFVIDEVSMVPDYLIAEARRHGIFLLFLGDPFQVQPIGGKNGILDKPDVFLDEIMRQKDGNSIVDWSMKVREGKYFSWENDEFVKILTRDELVTGMFDWADQIVCFTNRTRNELNHAVRSHKGFTSVLPTVGDKVIATQNNWERLDNIGENTWVNGTIGYVQSDFVHESKGVMSNNITLDIKPDFDGGIFEGVVVDGNPFLGYAEREFDGRKGVNRIEKIDFGSAITVHKSQGSEYDNVLLFEENWRPQEFLNILYTGGTRAKNKLVVVKKSVGSLFK